MMEVRNAQYNADGSIDCEWNHPKFGWIPFTATQQDAPLIYDAALALPPAAYVSPPDPTPEEVLSAKRATATLSRAEFFEAAYDAGFVTETEAEQGAAGNVIPQAFTDAIAALPASEQAKARIRFGGATEFDRMHQLIALVQAQESLTDAQVDAMYGID